MEEAKDVVSELLWVVDKVAAEGKGRRVLVGDEVDDLVVDFVFDVRVFRESAAEVNDFVLDLFGGFRDGEFFLFQCVALEFDATTRDSLFGFGVLAPHEPCSIHEVVDVSVGGDTFREMWCSPQHQLLHILHSLGIPTPPSTRSRRKKGVNT